MRSRRLRRAGGRREPTFWNRQPFDSGAVGVATTRVSFAFFTPGAFNTTSQDTRVTALRTHISVLLTMISPVVAAAAWFDWSVGMEKAETGSPAADPTIVLPADATADWLYLQKGAVQIAGANFEAGSFWSGMSGGGASLEQDIKSKRKLDANEELRLNFTLAPSSGATVGATWRIRFVASTLWQRTLR